jgi:hypothetical protein
LACSAPGTRSSGPRRPVAGGADEEDIAEAPTDDTEEYLPDQTSFLGRQVTATGRIVEVQRRPWAIRTRRR